MSIRTRTRIVENDRGHEFLVRIVRAGDPYGRDDCLIYDETDQDFSKDGEQCTFTGQGLDLGDYDEDRHQYDPLVEFFNFTDRPPHFIKGDPPKGLPFVSRYCLSTLEEDRRLILERDGLCLHGGDPHKYSITGKNYIDVIVFAHMVLAETL